MLKRLVSWEMEISVRLETAKVALSKELLGTVAGVQLAAVFQSPLLGLRFQVALAAQMNWHASRERSWIEKKSLRTGQEQDRFIAPFEGKSRS